MLSSLLSGGKPALARALARIESAPRAPETVALLDAAWAAPRGFALGLTGPPGVGKSTLTNALIHHWRARGLRVAVIAVDPSSIASGGALLGDRARLSVDPEDQGVFVRSIASRGHLGGLAALAWPFAVGMRALYDRVILETVGVGQSEIEIVKLADVTAVCLQPASGDALQFMKAGLMETPDVVAVAKADMGAPARRAAADLKAAMTLAAPRPDGWRVPALLLSAQTGEGVPEFVEAVEKRIEFAGAQLAEARARQAQDAVERSIREAWGRRGWEIASAEATPDDQTGPFAREIAAHERLERRLMR